MNGKHNTGVTEVSDDVVVNIKIKLSDLPSGKSRAELAGVERLAVTDLVTILTESPANKDLRIVGFLRVSDDKFIKVRIGKLNLLDAVLLQQEAHSVLSTAWIDGGDPNILCIG